MVRSASTRGAFVSSPATSAAPDTTPPNEMPSSLAIETNGAMSIPFSRTEMLDLVVVKGEAKGIVVRDMVTGKISSYAADAVVLATGGYGNTFFLSTNARGCNCMAAWRSYKRGAGFANPCYTQIHQW